MEKTDRKESKINKSHSQLDNLTLEKTEISKYVETQKTLVKNLT